MFEFGKFDLAESLWLFLAVVAAWIVSVATMDLLRGYSTRNNGKSEVKGMIDLPLINQAWNLVYYDKLYELWLDCFKKVL